LIAEVRGDDLAAIRRSRQTSFPKRHSSIIVGVALSVLFHAFALWYVFARNADQKYERPFGESSRLTVSLVPPSSIEKPQAAPSLQQNKEPHEPPKKTARPRKNLPSPPPQLQVRKPAPAIPPVAANVENKQLAPPPSEDMSSMLEAARRRRADAQSHEHEQIQEDEAQRRNKVVLANIATSINEANGKDRDARGGVFQLRRVGSNSAEFLFKGWSTNLRRNSTQLVEVFKKADPDIQTAIIKKMIEIIRENQHDQFVWESYRLGRDVTLSARPEDQAQLENFLMQEFFPDYVPMK
jgi:type IV secretory pathway VirB10-like protein